MVFANPNYAATGVFVDTLASLGMRHVCVSPGSRSAPLAVAFDAHPDITTWVHHDERSAAFFALGVAKTTHTPVAVVTTSGTAAAELLPAAVEARHGRVPLLLLTADRPPELRDIGAPQAIDQVKMYGSAVKWAQEAPLPEATETALRRIAALAGRAWGAALDEPPGPVHLNLPFREPLAPTGDPDDGIRGLPAVTAPRFSAARLVPDEDQLAGLAVELWGKRTMVICGPLDLPAFPEAVAELARTGRFPVLADTLSNVRAGVHDLSNIVAHGDALARAGLLDRDAPEAIIRFGAPPTSKSITTWLEQHPDVPQIVIDPAGWRDPGASATRVVRADPAIAARTLAKVIGRPAPEGWAGAWVEADRSAAEALAGAIRWSRSLTEPGVVLAVADALPDNALLWVASSMPVRDLDTYLPAIPRRLRVLANRGANGIDGFLSTGLGSAAVANVPTYVLAGDVATLHDLTALITAARLQIPVTFLTINNNGGGIFHFLPYAGMDGAVFQRLFATPHGLSFTAIARGFGIEAERIDVPDPLRAAIHHPATRPRLIEVITDRTGNVDVHNDAIETVRKRLRIS